MKSQRGAFLLVVLLVALLGLWWGIQRYAQAVPNEAQNPPPQTDKSFVVYHKNVDNAHTYTGHVGVRSCDSFSTQMQTTSGKPTRITLAFVVSSGDCSTPIEPVPFATSFSSSDNETPLISKVLLNTVEIPFVVIEDK